MELWEAIKGRRTTRNLTSDPVSDIELDRILEAARWAPSWANTQVWEFVLVFDKGVKERIADCLSQTNLGRNAILEAPVTIAVLGKKGIAGFKGGQPRTVLGDWFMFDVAMAVQNLCLAAWELGLGTVIVGSYDIEKATKVLEIPDDKQLTVLIPVGRPSQIPKAPRRKEITEFTHQNRHGNPWRGGGC